MTGKGRRAHGEGSGYEQRPGVWAAVVDLGWVNGKRKYVYAKTEAEAVAKWDDLRRRLQLGVDLSAPPRTVAAWLDEWLGDIKAHDGTRPSTLARYRQVIRTHLVRGLGRVKLDRLTPRDVERFRGNLRGGVAPATVVTVHGVLRVASSDAERLDLVPRNAAKAATPRRPSSHRRRTARLVPCRCPAWRCERWGSNECGRQRSGWLHQHDLRQTFATFPLDQARSCHR